MFNVGRSKVLTALTIPTQAQVVYACGELISLKNVLSLL